MPDEAPLNGSVRTHPSARRRATVVGYLLVFGILLWNPRRWMIALESVQGLLFLLVLPALGLVSGVWAVLEWPFSGTGLFVAGSYLGVVGLTLALGGVATRAVISALGVCLFALAFVATLASLHALWSYVQLDTSGAD